MKTEVYSWRVSAEVKTSLEREARRRKMSLAGVLDLAAREWLNKGSAESNDDREQARLHEIALKYVGAFEGDDPHGSENVSQKVRERLQQRYGR